MKKALIFGISGFVGRYLADEFDKHGYSVFGSDIVKSDNIPSYVQFYNVNILDPNAVESLILNIKPTHIVNLAAISSVGASWNIPQKTIAVNVEGILNILEGARKCEVLPRVLLIGSSEEYENTNIPLDESAKLNANNPYGISKLTQERFTEIYRKRFNMKIFCVRAFNHTGVGQRESFVIPNWCKQAAEISKSGRPGTMKVGNLMVKRDLSDVRDIVSAYRIIIESDDCNQVYNVGSGKTVLLKDLLEYIVSLSEQPIAIEEDPGLLRPIDNPVICCNNSLIRKKLGWKPEFTIFDTINKVFQSYILKH